MSSPAADTQPMATPDVVPAEMPVRRNSRVFLLGFGGVVLAMIVGLVLTGREAACTLMGGESYINLDTTALPITQLDRTEMCVDERCTRLGWLDQVSGDLERRSTFRIDGREQERTVLVRTLDGKILAGPASIELQDYHPNGRGCTPELLGGSFTALPDGTFDQVLVD